MKPLLPSIPQAKLLGCPPSSTPRRQRLPLTDGGANPPTQAPLGSLLTKPFLYNATGQTVLLDAFPRPTTVTPSPVPAGWSVSISYCSSPAGRACPRRKSRMALGGLGSSPGPRAGGGQGKAFPPRLWHQKPVQSQAQHDRQAGVICSATQECPSPCATYPGQMKAGCWGIRCQRRAALWPLLCFPLMHCGRNNIAIRALNLALERQAGETLKSCECFPPSPSQNRSSAELNLHPSWYLRAINQAATDRKTQLPKFSEPTAERPQMNCLIEAIFPWK